MSVRSTPCSLARSIVASTWRHVRRPQRLDRTHSGSMNLHDRATPLDPVTFPACLEAAGFTSPQLDFWSFLRFSARTP